MVIMPMPTVPMPPVPVMTVPVTTVPMMTVPAPSVAGRRPPLTALREDAPVRTPHLVLLAAVVLAGAACGSSDADPSVGSSNTTGTAATTASTDVSSTTEAVSTTALPATTTESTAPGTTLAPDDRFTPGCIERGPNRAPLPAAALPDTLGPLGAAPVVDIALPQVRLPDGTTDWSRTSAIAIPGGVLLWLVPYNSPTDVGMVAAVDADGAIRWQRCLDWRPTRVYADANSQSDEALVLTYSNPSPGIFEPQWEVWSLADGQVTRSFDDVVAASGITGDVAGYRTALYGFALDDVLLAPEVDGNIDMSVDSLLRIDLATMTATTVAMPPVALTGYGDDFATLPDGRLVAFGPQVLGAVRAVAAVQEGDGWTTDPAALQAARPAAVEFGPYVDSGDQPLVGIDAFGTELWRRADLNPINGEGFRVALDGDIAVASTCGPRDPSGNDWCPDAAVEGVDARTGRTVWRLDGQYGVSIVADGVALIAGPFDSDPSTIEPTVWTMIDTATGRQVADDQRWGEPYWFGIGCCDSPESAWVDDGVVFTVDEVDLQIWYPRQFSTPTVTVSLG
jgi:hypothetical protein